MSQCSVISNQCSVGTPAGPLHGPGHDIVGLADELSLAVRRWQPVPPCDGCGLDLRFEPCFIRLDQGGYGQPVANLCEGCLERHFARLRLAAYEHGYDRHVVGMHQLNAAFALCVLHGERRAA